MKTILKARVGSHLYGLNREDSDEDFLGVFVAPTLDVLGLKPISETHVSKDPDTTLHEVKKFISLCLGCNPTVLELLWVPEYILIDDYGELLVNYRERFLSTSRVRDAFGGYAYQQAKKLEKRENEGLEGFGPKVKKRKAKHARHCFRLLRQGRQLLETGTMILKVENSEEYFAFDDMSTEEILDVFYKEYEEYKLCPSILPEVPDFDALNSILLTIRDNEWRGFI